MTLRPLEVKPAASETWRVAVGLDRRRGRLTAPASSAARSTVGSRRTVIVALLAGRPLWAAMIVWKLVSPSPGMVVWTSSTRVGDRIVLGLGRLLEHRLGGRAGRRRRPDLEDLLRARVDELGRQERDEGQRGEEQDAGDRDDARVRPRDAQGDLMARRVDRDPERLAARRLVDLDVTLVDEQVRQDRHDRQRADERRQQRERDRQREGQEELADETADEADRQETRPSSACWR